MCHVFDMELNNYVVICFWILLSTVQLCFQKSTVSSPTYVGAVVEYSPTIPDVGHEESLLTLNAEKYTRFIIEAAEKDVDIIVFPEYELSSFGLPWRNMFSHPDFLTQIPDPEDKANPCVNESVDVVQAFREISCSARQQKIYVIVVAIERTPCDDEITCSLAQKFATSVAFDREGTVVGKYRDSNLHGEPLIEKPYPRNISTFNTDFGVTFGMISGMDIMSSIPAQELINRNITDFVYPHFWRNELPFGTALQIQAAWSRAHNVNLLAAAHSNPKIGVGGSGIHCGLKGTRNAYVTTNSSEIIIATLDKINHRQKVIRNKCAVDIPDCEIKLESYTSYERSLVQKDHLAAYSMLELSNYFEYRGTTGFVDSKVTLCHTSLCCSFEVNMITTYAKPGSKYKNMDPYGYYYRLVAFNGLKSLSSISTIGVQVCALIACRGADISSCGETIDSGIPTTMKTTFYKLSITGHFKREKSDQLPNILSQNLGLMPQMYYTFKRNESLLTNTMKIKMYTTIPNISLYTFGVYGRDFEMDRTIQSLVSEEH